MTLTLAPPSSGSRVEKPRRKRARKLKSDPPLGPFDTSAFAFDRGERAIEIVRLTPAAIVYRLKGLPDEYTLPHGVAFLKAVGLTADFDTAPRDGRIRRGT